MSREKPADIESQVRSLPYGSNEPKPPPSPDPEKASVEEGSYITRKPTLETWIHTTWAVVGHIISSAGIAIFVLVYMANRAFHVTDRFATVQTIGANVTLPFTPTQPDIVTILSGILYVQKLALAIWTGTLCWRIAIFLMEKRGLDPRDFKLLIKYQTLNPYTYFQTWITFLTGALFLASFAASASELILTGSISWVPKNELAYGLPIDPVELWDVEEGRPLSSFVEEYRREKTQREALVAFSAGRVNIGWGQGTEKGTYKRVSVSDSLGALAINSTIANTTLPYFEVHSLEWVKSKSDIPNFSNDSDYPAYDLLGPLFNSSPVEMTFHPVGSALLIPNVVTNWSNDPYDSITIRERRLLRLCYSVDSAEEESGVWSLTQDLPEDAYRHYEENSYYAFAWVTFSAGVGRCKEYNCIISSPSTVRNNTPIELEPNRLTAQALSLAPLVSNGLVSANSSIPFLWSSINDYVEAVLVRSYSGAWAMMNDNFWNTNLTYGYVPSYPSLVAEVHQGRVYGWLGIQLFAALLGTAFLVFQSYKSKFPFSEDPAFDAFFLDTTEVKKGDDKSDPLGSIKQKLKIGEGGNMMKVKVI